MDWGVASGILVMKNKVGIVSFRLRLVENYNSLSILLSR